MRSVSYLAMLLAFLWILSGCYNPEAMSEDTAPIDKSNAVMTLRYVTYRNINPHENTVFILEDGIFVPYLVFEFDSEQVLLLRKNLTQETVAYKDTNVFNMGGSYYPESDVDRFLNETYLNKYSDQLKSEMIEATIEVTSLETISVDRSIVQTEYISRKIFLLSATELGIRNAMAAKEGYKIDGLSENIASGSQWLRTAYLWDDVHAWAYSEQSYGGESVSSKLSVRPAFILSANLSIVKGEEARKDFQSPGFILEIET